jgi:hypothetical protein
VSQCNLFLLGCRIAPPSQANNKLLRNGLEGVKASLEIFGFIAATNKINRKRIFHSRISRGDLCQFMERKRG